MVRSSVDHVFAHLDDQTRLSAHMHESSWQMRGGRMAIELDQGRGQQVGSRMRLAGRVFGVELAVEEMVTERHPPYRKVWETIGSPRLLVIGQYRMGFELSPQGDGSMLRVLLNMRSQKERLRAGWDA